MRLTVLADILSGYTFSMTLKNAALLALIGMLVLSILLVVDFIRTVMGVADGLIPAVAIVRTVVYLFAALCATLFLYIFHRAQSR